MSTDVRVQSTDPQDISTAYSSPDSDTYSFRWANPPFSFTSDATNISGMVVEGKEDYGTINSRIFSGLTSVTFRHTLWNYTITGANPATNLPETHYILFENYVTSTIQFLFNVRTTVTIDGVLTYKLFQQVEPFHPFGLDYQTSYIVGMSKNVTLRSWSIANANVGQAPYCDNHGCDPFSAYNVAGAATFYNYTSAVWVTNPGAGRGAFNSLNKNNLGDAREDWYYAFNLTGPTGVVVTTTYDGPHPQTAGFVYAFCQACDSVAQANAQDVACNGLFTGLVFNFFGFCPNILGLATYVGDFVSSLITFPLRIVGNADAGTVSVTATGASVLIQSIVGSYTFGLALILTSPVQLATLTIVMGSSYSAVLGALLGDPRIAFRGSVLTVKWFGMFIFGYFFVLFYTAKAIVWLIIQFVALIIQGIGLARSFLKLI